MTTKPLCLTIPREWHPGERFNCQNHIGRKYDCCFTVSFADDKVDGTAMARTQPIASIAGRGQRVLQLSEAESLAADPPCADASARRGA